MWLLLCVFTGTPHPPRRTEWKKGAGVHVVPGTGKETDPRDMEASLGGSPTHLAGSVTFLPSHCCSTHTRRTVLASATS
jgi:hypothetical protein